MSAAQSDLDILHGMREQALTLTLAGDPLFTGAVAQLVGVIDGLMRVSQQPVAPAAQRRSSPSGESP